MFINKREKRERERERERERRERERERDHLKRYIYMFLIFLDFLNLFSLLFSLTRRLLYIINAIKIIIYYQKPYIFSVLIELHMIYIQNI